MILVSGPETDHAPGNKLHGSGGCGGTGFSHGFDVDSITGIPNSELSTGVTVSDTSSDRSTSSIARGMHLIRLMAMPECASWLTSETVVEDHAEVTTNVSGT